MTGPTFNQYAAPAAVVADVPHSEGYAALNFFNAEGRIGRLRYLAWLIGGGIVINIVTLIVAGILGALIPPLALVIGVIAWIPSLWFSIIVAIKRAHDFNASGWLSILSLVPLLGFLVFAVIPGTQGSNTYGPPPPPNTWGVRVLAAILPLIAIIGILAAVAIPQYKDYTDRAKAAQSARP